MSNEPLLQRLHLPDGLAGFEHLHTFLLSTYDPQTPFYWLRAEEDPDTAFIVLEPHLIVDDYAFDLDADVAQALAIHTQEDAFVLVLLTIPSNPAEMTANLLGPLVFNTHTGQGRQVVLTGSHYPVQYPLFPEGIGPVAASQEAAC
jgi:flagellar assembly factor FliW